MVQIIPAKELQFIVMFDEIFKTLILTESDCIHRIINATGK